MVDMLKAKLHSIKGVVIIPKNKEEIILTSILRKINLIAPKTQEIKVDIKVEGVDKEYTQADVNDGTIERDQERVDNEAKFGCFMTNAQIERGDCDIPEPIEEDTKDDSTPIG